MINCNKIDALTHARGHAADNPLVIKFINRSISERADRFSIDVMGVRFPHYGRGMVVQPRGILHLACAFIVLETN